MKKIIYILTAATLISCTKNNVAYEPTHEIGFTAVAGNITKAVVDGTTYPTDLNMYVFAWTTDYGTKDTEISPNYINKGEFKHKTVDGISKAVWGGYPNPYYWPNTKKLHFAGCSLSGNLDKPQTQVVEGPTPEYNCYTNAMTITDYSPLYGTNDGENDLMWFCSTEYTEANGYGKTTPYVSVNMYHTCSWITFRIQGDAATADKYTLTDIYMTDIDQTADVTCSAYIKTNEDQTKSIVPQIVWSSNEKEDTAPGANTYENININKSESGTLILPSSPVNVETGVADPTTGNLTGNIVVIPQVPGKLNLKYEYQSSTGAIIKEEYIGEKAIPLTIDNNTEYNNWLPGKHYIYTITIKANEILIAPTPQDWVEPGSSGNITVE